MSDTAKQLLEGLKEAVQAVAPGLKDVVAETKAELARQGTQTTAELASALFRGDAFVQYGAGQYTQEPDHGLEQEQQRGGMER